MLWLCCFIASLKLQIRISECMCVCVEVWSLESQFVITDFLYEKIMQQNLHYKQRKNKTSMYL